VARSGRARPKGSIDVQGATKSVHGSERRRCAVTIAAAVCVVLAAAFGAWAEIVRRAASIPETAEGLQGFVNAANALISPALVAMAAIAPLGCLVGAGALMFGSRRGMVIIGASLGTLIFLGSVKGIVA
jgi:hypothetical protein